MFPHNNRGIHGHPAPHQSTERDGGMGRLKDGKDRGRDGLAEGRKVHENKRNGGRGMHEEGRSGFPRGGEEGCRGQRGINKGKEEKG